VFSFCQGSRRVSDINLTEMHQKLDRLLLPSTKPVLIHADACTPHLSFLHSEPPTPNLAPPSHRTAPPSATSIGPIRVDTPGADQGQNRWAEKKGLMPFSFQRIFSSILIKFKSWKYFAIHIYIYISYFPTLQEHQSIRYSMAFSSCLKIKN
jgi:hypothetical protein